MIEITNLQQLWLNSRGGRTIRDVLSDNGNLYILLWFYGTYRRYLVPTDEDIKAEYHVRTGKFNKVRLACRFD